MSLFIGAFIKGNFLTNSVIMSFVSSIDSVVWVAYATSSFEILSLLTSSMVSTRCIFPFSEEY